jgi:hypothetical protein
VSQLQGRVARNNLTFIIHRNEFARTSFFSNKTKLPTEFFSNTIHSEFSRRGGKRKENYKAGGLLKVTQ